MSTTVHEAAAPSRRGPADLAGRAAALLDAVADLDLHALTGQDVHDLIDELENLARRVAGIRAAALSVAEANGLWATSNARTFASWLAVRTQSSTPAANRAVKEARTLRDHLPATREALVRGRIGHEHAGALARHATRSPAQREALGRADVGEEFLVDHARQMNANHFTRLVKGWAHQADPEHADRSWRSDTGSNHLTLAATLDGYHLQGWLDTAGGQALETALTAEMGRPATDDPRPYGQRRADALVGLARHALDNGHVQPGARIRPHLSVTVSYETLRALADALGTARPQLPPGTHQPDLPLPATERDGGRDDNRTWVERWAPGDDHIISAAIDYPVLAGHAPATLEDGQPIPSSLLARLACDSQLTRIVFGPGSTVLDVGRTQRIFPAHHTRAIIARDRRCQYPDCQAPPSRCEVHHSLWWSRHHGRTAVDHGILLCWHHHAVIHSQQIDIHRVDGHWQFRDRNGRTILGHPPPGPVASPFAPSRGDPARWGTTHAA